MVPYEWHYAIHIHWNWNVFILMKLSLLAALEVVKMTTSSAANDENFVKMIFSSLCMASQPLSTQQSWDVGRQQPVDFFVYTQQTHYAIITSFWLYNDVIITYCVQWVMAGSLSHGGGTRCQSAIFRACSTHGLLHYLALLYYLDNATYFVKSASKPKEHVPNDTINASKCPNWNKINWSQNLGLFDRDSICQKWYGYTFGITGSFRSESSGNWLIASERDSKPLIFCNVSLNKLLFKQSNFQWHHCNGGFVSCCIKCLHFIYN